MQCQDTVFLWSAKESNGTRLPLEVRPVPCMMYLCAVLTYPSRNKPHIGVLRSGSDPVFFCSGFFFRERMTPVENLKYQKLKTRRHTDYTGETPYLLRVEPNINERPSPIDTNQREKLKRERKATNHPALCNAPPQWLRMRHQSHQRQRHGKTGVTPPSCNAPPQWLRMSHQSHQSHQRHQSHQ